MRLVGLLAVVFFVAAGVAPGQTYRVLHTFGGTVKNAGGANGPDGVNSNAGVAFDQAGDMFGTASSGGAKGVGMVWEITAAGVYKDLHDFGATVTNANGASGPDGAYPIGGLTVDAKGNLYGAVSEGGPNGTANGGFGMVWEITAAGTYVDLHDFGGTVTNAGGSSGADGVLPCGGVALDAKGNLYGTTSGGGPNDTDSGGDGMVWSISPSGTYTDLHDFGGTITNANGSSGPDGVYPSAGVTLDAAGDLFGTTPYGGAINQADGGSGIIWEITSNGNYKDLHDFGGVIMNANGQGGPDGATPWAAATLDASGNLYGTTLYGGPYATDSDSGGLLWMISPTGTYKDLHDFGGTVTNANGQSGPDGARPVAGVTLDAAGNIYGATIYGGPNDAIDSGDGIVWEVLKSSSKYVDLHDFGGTLTATSGAAGPDGTDPAGGVTVDAGGNIYGTTYFGGANGASIGGDGLAWVITPAALKSVGASPTTVVGGTSSVGTVTLSSPAPTGGSVVTVASNSVAAVVPASVTVPAGATSVTFTIKTTAVTANATATLTAGFLGVSKTATLTVDAPALASIVLSPTTLTGPASSTGTVTLTGPAATGGVTVTLSSSSASAIVPASITLAAGKINATFTVTTVAVPAPVTATIKATFGSVTKQAALVINPSPVTSLTLNPTTVIGATSSIATVKIGAAAPASGQPISLSSNSASVKVPGAITIPAGTTSTTFTVTTLAVTANVTATITASDPSGSKVATLIVDAPTLASVTLSPTVVIGGSPSTVTVTITGPAPVGGFILNLSSSTASATVPASVVVPAGKTTMTLTVKTTAVKATTTATITAKNGSVTKTATLTINP